MNHGKTLQKRTHAQEEQLTFVTTFCSSPVCSSNVDSLYWHCMLSLWPLGPPPAYRAGPVLMFIWRFAVCLVLLARGWLVHVMFGSARRKLSENWLNPINNAGIHVSTISCFWYFPNPPREGRTDSSMWVSSSGDAVSGVTKPFSGWRSPVSSCITAIAVVTPIDASDVWRSRGFAVLAPSLLSTPQCVNARSSWRWKPYAVNHWNGNKTHLFIIRKHFPLSGCLPPKNKK